jgi:D-glycero-alpha-D-manno-heptose 1-phosphate guanylyltransferase
MQVTEAIILAGGLGTRLQEAVPDRPKCLAMVAGRPMLSFIIDDLRIQGVTRFIFSLGYKAEMVVRFLEEEYPTLEKIMVKEEEPLGTGGAIQLSLSSATSEQVLVVNGDTLFKVKLHEMSDFYMERKMDCLLALKPMFNYDRYGSVQLDASGRIVAFTEKQFAESGLINGGIYIISRTALMAKQLPSKFSFEKDYLEAFVSEGRFYGLVQHGYFIDIGIPEDFEKAGRDLHRKPSLQNIDKSWSIFLDRDGVINKEIVGTYVLNVDEFEFLPGVVESFAALNSLFGKIFVVSNQRGVGKGLMPEEALAKIHNEMQNIIEENGGRIDRIYYCTDINDTCFERKPNPGMAVKAKKDFPSIDLQRSIMVGNKPSDMRFGRSAGMVTVFVTTTNPDQSFPHPDIDFIFPSLSAFVNAVKH